METVVLGASAVLCALSEAFLMRSRINGNNEAHDLLHTGFIPKRLFL